MKREYDVAPAELLRYQVRYTVRDEQGNLQGAGRALIQKFNSREEAELAAAELRRNQ